MPKDTQEQSDLRLRKRNEISALESRTCKKLEEYERAFEKVELLGKIQKVIDSLQSLKDRDQVPIMKRLHKDFAT